MHVHCNIDAETKYFSSLHHAKKKKQKKHVVSNIFWLEAKLPLTSRKCVKSYFWIFSFLMRPVRLDFTHIHGVKWFGAGWRKRGRWNACSGEGILTVPHVSCCTKQTSGLSFKAFKPTGSCSPSSLVHFTWKCQWRRMALAFSCCLCPLQYPLVSAAVGLFCTWQLGAGRCCVQCNWMMWYCFASSWMPAVVSWPTTLITFFKATKKTKKRLLTLNILKLGLFPKVVAYKVL